ncbi:DUF6233 domain-containing protein [Streptomyces sp. H10-C2]|uniref:DUF6233 domain-containing protein n=1 Tax=unclassified Streptomyces TaxID=2593676 RepID=UPI0024BB09EF|nr:MULTISPECIES: DUF6233 domain-containing protein [unclassified Streptomyces]MDJ0347038.1 DUF6233 domain-containing protein [Streptomyces sp. PH10-H1]MDJ0375306.1 DUF6233 domain-containing protein [Streptomyces sp. H10-C2]
MGLVQAAVACRCGAILNAVRQRRSPRRTLGPPASGPDPPPADEWQLHTLGGDPPQRSVHHTDCWIPAKGEELTTAQARQVAANDDVAADCTVCHVS